MKELCSIFASARTFYLSAPYPMKTVVRKILLAFLYVAAIYLSVQIPAQHLKSGHDNQFAFEQQSYCLIPIEEQGHKPLNTCSLLPVIDQPLPEFTQFSRYLSSLTITYFRKHRTPEFNSYEEIIISMRRLRI